jgi:hypothetical protein
MGGPGSGRKRKPAKASPRGARWRETRAQVLAGGDICHICGHPGAGDVDHIIPVAEGDVAGYYDRSNLAPAHGTHSPCAVCGVACNQVKGRRLPGGPMSVSQRLLASIGANGNGTPAPAPAPGPEPVLVTDAEIDAEMERIGPHWDGCGCRQKIARGMRFSRCW